MDLLYQAGFPEYRTLSDILFYSCLIPAVAWNFRSKSLAERLDLVHQFFCECAESWRVRFDPSKASLSTFIRDSAKNRSLSATSARIHRLWRHDEPSDMPTGLDLSDFLPSLVEEDFVEDMVSRSYVDQVISGADPGAAEIARLHLVDGYSFVEIGKMLGQKPGTVRMRFERSKEQMKGSDTG